VDDALPAPSVAPTPVQTGGIVAPPALAELDVDGLRSLEESEIFFAHRSVGADIVELGIPAVYQDYGLSPPGDSFGDHWLDQTDDPESKLRDFEHWIRDEGVGENADAALMKLGYIDIVADTDVRQVFDRYLSMMDALEADYPDAVFLHATVSVTAWVPENNAAIERFNSLMRERYGDSGRLFDLARIVSTCSDGTRPGGETERGERFFSICDEYTRDGGHLNEPGAKAAAVELLRLFAHAVN
jgi:hypothetical protein